MRGLLSFIHQVSLVLLSRETLENQGQPRENTHLIAVAGWGHVQQAARLALRARLRLR